MGTQIGKMPASITRPEAPATRRQLELEISPVPQAPSLGRRALGRLADAVGPGRLADLELIASELITNCVLHAGLDATALVRMRVDVSARRVRIEVEDAGRGFEPRAVPPGGDRRGGRGLALVDRLSSRWGFSRADTTLVWAEIDDDRALAGAAR